MKINIKSVLLFTGLLVLSIAVMKYGQSGARLPSRDYVMTAKEVFNPYNESSLAINPSAANIILNGLEKNAVTYGFNTVNEATGTSGTKEKADADEKKAVLPPVLTPPKKSSVEVSGVK